MTDTTTSAQVRTRSIGGFTWAFRSLGEGRGEWRTEGGLLLAGTVRRGFAGRQRWFASVGGQTLPNLFNSSESAMRAAAKASGFQR